MCNGLSSSSGLFRNFILTSFFQKSKSSYDYELPSLLPIIQKEDSYVLVKSHSVLCDGHFESRLSDQASITSMIADSLDMRAAENQKNSKVEFYSSVCSVSLKKESLFITKILESACRKNNTILSSNFAFLIRDLWTNQRFYLYFLCLLHWTVTVSYLVCILIFKRNPGKAWDSNSSMLVVNQGVVLLSTFILSMYEIIVLVRGAANFFFTIGDFMDLLSYLLAAFICGVVVPLSDIDDSLQLINMSTVIVGGVLCVRSIVHLRVFKFLRFTIMGLVKCGNQILKVSGLYLVIVAFLSVLMIQVEKTAAVNQIEEILSEKYYRKVFERVYLLGLGGYYDISTLNSAQYSFFILSTIVMILLLLNFAVAAMVKELLALHKDSDQHDLKNKVRILLNWVYFASIFDIQDSQSNLSEFAHIGVPCYTGIDGKSL